MGGQTGRKIHPQRGWDYLKRVGFSLQVPRPRHHKADPAQQEAFKRELLEQVKRMQQIYPQAKVELWSMDEHRVGLKPVIRRVWTHKGHRPVIRVQQRYEWLYIYGFVHPESGASQWLLLPTVNVEVFSIALKHFALAVGAGPNLHIMLVLDCAGWHKSGELVIPEGIHLVFLPPTHRSCSPANASGRSLTKPLPIVVLRPWMSCKRCKQSGMSPFKTIRPASVTPLPSVGGLVPMRIRFPEVARPRRCLS